MGALRGVYGLRTVVPGRGGEREEVYHIVLHLEDRRALAVHHGERWRAHRTTHDDQGAVLGADESRLLGSGIDG